MKFDCNEPLEAFSAVMFFILAVSLNCLIISTAVRLIVWMWS